MKIFHDNRGGQAMYGYIYFTRGKDEYRVGWTSSHGIFPCRDTPNDIKPGEVFRLRQYAEQHKLF